MKTLALVALFAATAAQANNWPPAEVPAPAPATVQHLGQGQQQLSGQQQGQEANALANATNGSLYNMPRSQYYSVAFAAPAMASALPPGLCPKNRSVSWSIVVASYSSADVGTDHLCLDKVLAVMNSPRIVEHRLPVTAEIHPRFTPAAPIASSTRICAPVKKAVRKAKVACK